MKNYFLFIFLALALIISACSSGDQNAQQPASETLKESHPQGQASYSDDVSATNILQIAIGSKDHSTLVAGVQAAEIEHVLVNAGPLTVFAPTNEAFGNLPEGTLETLLKPENKSTLAFVITHHAAPGTFKGEGLKDGMRLYMASGHYLNVEHKDGAVYIDGAKILGTVDASNGVVHVVDKVLVPAE